jgi:hypothetical protein
MLFDRWNMLRLKRKPYVSKRDAYKVVFSCLTMPYMFAGFGIYFVVWWRGQDTISYEHAENVIYLVVIFSVIILVYSWHKAFGAVRAIMSKEFDKLPDIPETVICLKCGESFPGRDIKGSECAKYGGSLEDLRGFYERHPELK